MNYLKNASTKSPIRGLELNIDAQIQQICEASNKSSSHTRGILYVLVLVSVISIVGIINTSLVTNWTSQRIKFAEDNYKRLELKTPQKTKRDSIDLLISQIILQKQLENKIEKIELVQIPIIGNVFDMNNLCLVSGISFIIMLNILKYTSRREKKNLRIALHAITQRYPDADEYLNPEALIIDINKKVPNLDIRNIKIISEEINIYNFIRRKYHYNFLSMNEVFTIPKDTLDKYERGEELDESLNSARSWDAKVVFSYFLYLPSCVYFLLFLNDCSTFLKGSDLSSLHAWLQIIITYFILIYICHLCRRCNNEKLVTQAYYDHAFEHKFTLKIQNVKANIHENKKFKPSRLRKLYILLYLLLYPLIMFFELRFKKPLEDKNFT